MNNFNQEPKEGYGYIYKYTSPSGKSYIGQTKRSLLARAVAMTGIGYKNCTLFYRAIKKYGFENFKWEILGEFSSEELDDKEIYYIELFNTLAPNGYNSVSGGHMHYNTRSTTETPVLQYDLKGNFVKRYESVTQAALDNNTIYQAISAVLQRKRPQHKDFIYRYEGEPAPELYEKKKCQGRLTGQYDLAGNLINTYPSASSAGKALGKGETGGRNIRAACQGKRPTAYGFKWKFLD